MEFELVLIQVLSFLFLCAEALCTWALLTWPREIFMLQQFQ